MKSDPGYHSVILLVSRPATSIPNIFQEGLGVRTGAQASLLFSAEAQPLFLPQETHTEERSADNFKRVLLNSREDEIPRKFLFTHGTTLNPAEPNGKSPVEARMRRLLRTIHEAMIPTEEPPRRAT
ncbi:hypothetical protein FGIG_10502 [Fasciola gigantica]|uniref:Uncharacterized protein n=1 Tax=Fasciola gigantica TaxID=46835 RepID=A0A504YN15_FASGI|nr:hypothetical protein FGIG_10502 [Fasciola gigantica]